MDSSTDNSQNTPDKWAEIDRELMKTLSLNQNFDCRGFVDDLVSEIDKQMEMSAAASSPVTNADQVMVHSVEKHSTGASSTEDTLESNEGRGISSYVSVSEISTTSEGCDIPVTEPAVLPVTIIGVTYKEGIDGADMNINTRDPVTTPSVMEPAQCDESNTEIAETAGQIQHGSYDIESPRNKCVSTQADLSSEKLSVIPEESGDVVEESTEGHEVRKNPVVYQTSDTSKLGAASEMSTEDDDVIVVTQQPESVTMRVSSDDPLLDELRNHFASEQLEASSPASPPREERDETKQSSPNGGGQKCLGCCGVFFSR